MTSTQILLKATQHLSDIVSKLDFADPVTHVYNPLEYAGEPYEHYLLRYGSGTRETIFIGMNPGPFGMVQCGIPFGEIAIVRDWLKIEGKIEKPRVENPKRPVEGFSCTRSEVSGRRLWGLFRERFSTPERFFERHFVANYCPLAFFNEGRNLTPDKLPAKEAAPLYAACDDYLRILVKAFSAKWVIGVGAFASKRAHQALDGMNVNIGTILHPSPASPAANRGWNDIATKQMIALGIWS